MDAGKNSQRYIHSPFWFALYHKCGSNSLSSNRSQSLDSIDFFLSTTCSNSNIHTSYDVSYKNGTVQYKQKKKQTCGYDQC